MDFCHWFFCFSLFSFFQIFFLFFSLTTLFFLFFFFFLLFFNAKGLHTLVNIQKTYTPLVPRNKGGEMHPEYPPVRFIPKNNSIRPISNLSMVPKGPKGPNKTKKKKFQKFQKLKSMNKHLEDTYQACKALTLKRPEMNGLGVHGLDGVYFRIAPWLRNVKQTSAPLYIGKTDVASCFDSILPTKLLNIVHSLFDEETNNEKKQKQKQEQKKKQKKRQEELKKTANEKDMIGGGGPSLPLPMSLPSEEDDDDDDDDDDDTEVSF